MQVLQGSLPEEYQELREPSIPDLSYVLGQVRQTPLTFGLVLHISSAHHHFLEHLNNSASLFTYQLTKCVRLASCKSKRQVHHARPVYKSVRDCPLTPIL